MWVLLLRSVGVGQAFVMRHDGASLGGHVLLIRDDGDSQDAL